MWAALGQEPTVALASWPTVDERLLVEDSVTCVVQVGGKLRARLEVPPGISADALQAAVLADPAVQKALAGREVRRVVVRPPRLVNIVPG
jgi:leucyl-tRNA synthetase